MKKRILLILQFIILFSLNLKNVYAAISLNYKELNIGVDASIQLNVYGDNTANVKWTTSDSKVATVANGRIFGTGIGTAYISVSDGSYTDTCKVNVIKNYVPVSNITLSESSGSVLINEKIKINASIRPTNASNKFINYSSSDTSIAIVDATGEVIGRKGGVAYITITAEGKSTSYKVTVIDTVALKGISLSKTQIELNEDESSRLYVTFNPSNATNKGVSWKSSDESVATVDSSGNVSAKKSGNATITVTSREGGYTASAKVIVNAIDKTLKGISLNETELTLDLNETANLEVSYNPGNADNKKVTWSSSNNRVVTVDNGKLTAIKPGKAEIKVVSDEGRYEANCKVTVLSPPIESIKFANETQTVYIGNTVILETISTPEDTAINDAVWTSSDETVATVIDGVLTPLKVGTTTVTVSDKDGEITASTVINVEEKPLDNLMITVDGYDLGFNVNTKDYTLKINTEKSLNIKVNRDSSKVIIAGINDLKNGSIITITVIDKGQTTYVINIKKTEIPIIPFIIVITVLLLINIIRIVIKNKKGK